MLQFREPICILKKITILSLKLFDINKIIFVHTISLISIIIQGIYTIYTIYKEPSTSCTHVALVFSFFPPKFFILPSLRVKALWQASERSFS